MPKKKKVLVVLLEVHACVNKGIIYNRRNYRNNEGCPTLIKSGSTEELIIADWTEQGLGFRNKTIMVNEHCLDECKIHFGRSTVRNALRRMNPIITKVKKRIQGSKYNVNWKNTRTTQCKQCMAMLGKIT